MIALSLAFAAGCAISPPYTNSFEQKARAVAEDVKAGLPSSHPKATLRGPDVFFVDRGPGGGRRRS